jgi:hypothetical protein
MFSPLLAFQSSYCSACDERAMLAIVVIFGRRIKGEGVGFCVHGRRAQTCHRTNGSKENTDKLMYYAFVTRQNTFKKHSDFNSFFRERFGRGLAIIENSQEDRQKAMEILKKHGLPTD